MTRLSEHHCDEVAFTTIGEMSDPHVIARFTVDGDPVTKSRARWNAQQRRAYTPAKTVAAEQRVLAEYLRVARPEHRKDAAHTFGVVAVFFVPHNANRRDVDNMLKLVLDALNGWAWADDSQVSEVIGRKALAFPAEETRTEIAIYRTGQVTNGGKEQICPSCGKTFQLRPSEVKRGRLCCSQACAVAHRVRARTRTCPTCQTEFVAHSAAAPQIHCSQECRYEAARVAVTCATCGTDFKKARSANRRGNSYCSPECKATYWREQRKSAARGACQDCGGPTTKKAYARCRDCHYAAGGRWADRGGESVKCPTCGSFMGKAGCSRCAA